MHQNKLSLIEFLQERISTKLSGIESHLKMAPLLGDEPFRTFKPESNSYQTAVLIILTFNKNDTAPSVLLTLRSGNLNSHKGQISFPGGHLENGESSTEAALREANEEIGLISENIKIIGKLSDLYVPPSKSLISPILCYQINEQEWKINPDEVDELFFVSLNTLLEPSIKVIEKWKIGKELIDVPFWNVHPTTPLWGATAMIISELLDLYEEYKDNF
jgi:8-oxo-dGTP pyrophosphatase MutT (NUDIX family)